MNAQASHPPLRSPRDWAAAILAEPSRERRNQLLDACPGHWRELVREHVQSAFARVAQYRQHKTARAEAAGGRAVVDFGARRMHGADAAVKV